MHAHEIMYFSIFFDNIHQDIFILIDLNEKKLFNICN